MIRAMIPALSSLDSQVVVFVLGAGAWGFFAWLKHWLESLRAHTTANAAKLDEAEDAGHDQTVKVSEAIATILTSLQEHARRLEAVERDAAEQVGLIQHVDRTVAVNGEQARSAIADMSGMKSELRSLSDRMVAFGIKLETHDERTRESAGKLDRLLDLFTRGIARASA